jgi:hypothetical protein
MREDLSGGTPASVSASGALGGATNSPGVAQFPSNGATAGHDGLIENTTASTILYCTSPNTVIATSPTNPTTVAAGDFTFTSPQSGVTFECSLDETDQLSPAGRLARAVSRSSQEAYL